MFVAKELSQCLAPICDPIVTSFPLWNLREPQTDNYFHVTDHLTSTHPAIELFRIYHSQKQKICLNSCQHNA